MNTRDLVDVLPTLMSELALGSPDPANDTYMLNRGDPGLLGSLERISAAAASHVHQGGASIAAHVDHLRYGLSLVNAWAAGHPEALRSGDWTTSWKKTNVSESEWRALRDDLRREATAWIEALRTPREMSREESRWVVGNTAHFAYHVGAIRQMDRALRGPTAEDEVRAKAAR